MAIRHTYLKITRLVQIIMSYCSSPYRVCFSPKYNKESQSPLLYPFPEMEKQTVLPIHTSRPDRFFFKRSRLLADHLFEFTIWVRGWDTKARRPCFSGVAQSIGKTQTRTLVFLLYLLPKLKRL